MLRLACVQRNGLARSACLIPNTIFGYRYHAYNTCRGEACLALVFLAAYATRYTRAGHALPLQCTCKFHIHTLQYPPHAKTGGAIQLPRRFSFFILQTRRFAAGGCLRSTREHPQPVVNEGREGPLSRVNGSPAQLWGRTKRTKCALDVQPSRLIPPQTPACSRSCARPAPPASEIRRRSRRFPPADVR